MAIDRQSLKDAGLVWDEPVKIHLWDTTVGSALGAVFAAAGDRGSVAFASNGGFIVVAAGARAPVEIRVYDARDLIERAARYEPATQPTITSDSELSMPPGTEAVLATIENVIDTDSWRDNGGTAGFVAELAGRFIVVQTPRNHERIAALLRTLRAGGSKEGMRVQDAPQTVPSTP